MDTITAIEKAHLDINEYRTMRIQLDTHVIPPRRVVGGGYKNGRKVATAWILNQLRSNMELLTQLDPSAVINWGEGEQPTNKQFIRAAEVTYGYDHKFTREVAERYSK